MPGLKIYKKEQLNLQLLCQLRQVNKSQFHAKTDNFLVSMPKLLKWFQIDFLTENDIEQRTSRDKSLKLEQSQSSDSSKTNEVEEQERNLQRFVDVMAENEATKYNGEMAEKELREVANQIRAEKKLNGGKALHELEWYRFEWNLDYNYFLDCIKQVAADDK